MRRERIIAFFDSFTEAAVLILTVFVLLIYGAAQDYVPAVIGFVAVLVLAAWLIRFLLTGALYWVNTGMLLPLAVLAVTGLVHLVKLPAPFVAWVSPFAVSQYQSLLGGQLPVLQAVALFPYQAWAGVGAIVFCSIMFFAVVNVTNEKECITRYVAAVVAAGTALGVLWLVQMITGDFADVLASFLNCREDHMSMMFNRDYFLWFAPVPFFFAVGLLCADGNRERKAFYACACGVLALAIVFSGKVAIYRGIVCGAVFFCGFALVTARAHLVVRCLGTLLVVAAGCALFMKAGWLLRVIPAGFPAGDAAAAAGGGGFAALAELARHAGAAGSGAGVGCNLALFGLAAGTGAERLLAGYGIAGFCAFGAAVAVYFLKNVRMLFKRKDSFVRMVSLGGMAGLVTVLFGSLVENPFGSPAMLVTCTVSSALCFVLLRIRFVDAAESDDGAAFFDVRVIKVRPAMLGLLTLASIAVIAGLGIPLARSTAALYSYRKSTYKLPVESYASVETPYSSILGFIGSAAHLDRREKSLLKAIELDPQNPRYYFELGRFYRNTDKLRDGANAARAQEAFLKARALDPFNPAYASDGFQVLDDGSTGVARQETVPAGGPQGGERAAEIQKMEAGAVELLKKSKGSRDALVRALEEFRKVAAADPSRTGDILAACARRSQDYDLLKIIVQDVPNGPEILALFLYNRNAWDKNAGKFHKEMAAVPEDKKYPYCAALAEMAVQSGDYQGAITLMEGYAARCPANPDASFWVAERSSFYPKQYRDDFVEKHFRQALALAPDNVRYQMGYCRYLYGRKRYQNAADALLRLADKAPAHPEVFFLLGQCYERLSSAERALEMYEKALAADPSHIEARSKVETLRK